MKKTAILMIVALAAVPTAQAGGGQMAFERAGWNTEVLQCGVVGGDNVHPDCSEECGGMGNIPFVGCAADFIVWVFFDCGQFYTDDSDTEDCTDGDAEGGSDDEETGGGDEGDE